MRLTHGVPGNVADLAREAGPELLHGDYCALAKAGWGEPDTLAPVDDSTLLALVEGDRVKLALVRRAAERVAARRADAAKASTPVLDAYVA